MNIYNKYLIKKKRKYFLLYHSKASKKSSKSCRCQCSCLNPNIHKIYGSIPLNRDNFPEKKINFKKNIRIARKQVILI